MLGVAVGGGCSAMLGVRRPQQPIAPASAAEGNGHLLSCVAVVSKMAPQIRSVPWMPCCLWPLQPHCTVCCGPKLHGLTHWCQPHPTLMGVSTPVSLPAPQQRYNRTHFPDTCPLFLSFPLPSGLSGFSHQ